MAGKMTILDRLVSQGKISRFGSPGSKLEISGALRDPLSYPLEMRKAIKEKYADNKSPRTLHGNYQWVKMTPERQVYQQGLKNQFWKKEGNLRREQDEAMDRVDELQQSYELDFNDARDRLAEDVSSEITGWDPEEIQAYEAGDYESPNYRIEDYWEGEYNLPEYDDLMSEADDAYNEAAGRLIDWQNSGMRDLQLRSPRYRNYQRAMQQRAANKQIGHQLSRMWGDAYQRLRARGLSDAEARMFIRERFGGR